MEGRDFLRPGESFSSRVDRRVVDSGGDMYPESPVAEPEVAGAHEYGGGGPECAAVGLDSGAVEMLSPFIK